MFRKLDVKFPRSRFILTVRHSESWWRSIERWLTFSKPWMTGIYCRHLRVSFRPSRASTLISWFFTWQPLEVRQKRLELLKQDMIREYERYNGEVIDYFSSRDNLLTLDFEKDPGWEPLCRFLELPSPALPFPHANRQHYDARDETRIWRPNLERILNILKKSKLG